MNGKKLLGKRDFVDFTYVSVFKNLIRVQGKFATVSFS